MTIVLHRDKYFSLMGVLYNTSNGPNDRHGELYESDNGGRYQQAANVVIVVNSGASSAPLEIQEV